MILTETYQERLKNWFDPNHFTHAEGNCAIPIVEKGKGGRPWRLDCHVKNEVLLFRLEKSGLPYIRQRKIADAVMLEILKDKNVRLHIIECKTTVNQTSWKHIKNQFEGALLNALGILGVLEMNIIDDVTFYTAYVNNLLNPKESPLPIAYKNGVGVKFDKMPSDWLDNHISILSIHTASHIKIQLSETDQSLEGEVELQ